MSSQSPHATLQTFGYPQTLIGETAHWAVLLRPKQLTAGSLVVVSRSDATAFGALPAGAHADLAVATRAVETMLAQVVGYERINWLMLMMVDPHVHFHVFARYAGARSLAGAEWPDVSWPGPPNLAAATTPEPHTTQTLLDLLRAAWQRLEK